VRSLEQVMSASVARPRLVMTLLLAFAAVGLALGAVGVYGVVAFAASQRTHEIGVRLALGAAPRSIVRLVLGRGLAYAAAGVTLGLLAALAATPALGGLVHGVGVADPATYALLALLILGVAAAASYLPARRAARLDPMRVLRGEG
jgi:putative ABC transport system permease protein